MGWALSGHCGCIGGGGGGGDSLSKGGSCNSCMRALVMCMMCGEYFGECGDDCGGCGCGVGSGRGCGGGKKRTTTTSINTTTTTNITDATTKYTIK